MLRKIISAGLVLGLSLSMVVGCAQNTNPVEGSTEVPKTDVQKADVSKADNPEPVTLQIIAPGYVEEELAYVIPIVKEKYPWVTLEVHKVATNPDKVSELLTSGIRPDLFGTSSQRMDAFTANGLVGSNDELFKKNKFDISIFDDKAMETIKIASGGSFHSAVPIVGGFSALYYNKDLFNKFGVDYPKDGMTWKQVIELSRKVARTDGGTTYYGLNPDGLYRSAGQFSLPYVDPKTGNAVISSNPGWKRVFETQKEIYSIPGNPFDFEGKDNALAVFLRGQLAMYATDDHMQDSEKAGLNWDIVSYPEYEEKRGVSLEYDLHIMGVTPTSKNPDAAFLVLKTIASDEVQKKLSMDGFVTARKAPEIKKLFAQNLSFAKNKNIAALFKTTPAVPAPPHPYGVLQTKIRQEVAYTAGEKVFVQGIDINTALREADEAINKMIAPLKNK